MGRISVLVALAALALCLLSACGGGSSAETIERGSRFLVVYGREGGIRFESSTLAVSTKGFATARSEGCTARFRLGARIWRRLRQVLKRTDLSLLAGYYPAPAGAADVTTETIVVGSDTVRIGDFSSLPAGPQQALAPLLGVLGQVLDRRGRSSCEHGRK